ncbi:response regulator transcription factor [Rhizobium leguminosarum]|uniref:response regulator transcription factor n=1 Tax=Rhizobium leguminosarum TaxID=384 RepID=UPI001C96AA16|nr:response regulator transcription factor [Rhizobium leguminosarum]MBY5705719.1 response regulator transcription factor [Rhizobium leguminosarum]
MRKTEASKDLPAVVFVVDDDISMRDALTDLFLSMNLNVEAFETPAAFLERARSDRHGCILLDVRLPGLNGLDFQSHLDRIGNQMPIVFMTGFGDVPMSVKAMKAGAIDFLIKPFKDQDILDAVAVALKRDLARRRRSSEMKAVQELMRSLTPRERETMLAVAKGLMNKQIAHQLGISEVTVKLHRGSVMRKLNVRSVADLVRMVELLNEDRDSPAP